MTKHDAKQQMLRWLDEATSNGTPAPADQIADLLERADYLLDGVVKFLAGQFKLPAVYSVVRAPVRNLLGHGFPARPVVPPDVYRVTAPGGRSLYLEVCGDVQITARINGREARTWQVSAGQFEPVRGNIDNPGGGVLEVTVTGDYPFVVRNAAVYPCAFASDGAVQEYIPFVPYELPEDYRMFDKLLQTSDRHEYRRFPDYRREGMRTFLLPFEAQGQFDFHYFRNPQTIPPDAPEDTVLEVESHAAQLVALKLAVDCTLGVEDTLTVGCYLDSRFNSMLVNLLANTEGEPMRIDTAFSMC